MRDPDLSAVPLFPLPGVVLFPRAVLPLHIFEDRYRAMTADALAGDRLVAMALLKEGWEKSYYGKPAIEPAVCVGKIISHEKLPDGKYNFLLQGTTRAAVVKELPIELPYRLAELRRIEIVEASEENLSYWRQRLFGLFAAGPLASMAVGKQFRNMIASGWECVDLADMAAFTFLDDIRLKQSLLAEPDVLSRVTRTVEALEQMAATLPKVMSIARNVDPSLN